VILYHFFYIGRGDTTIRAWACRYAYTRVVSVTHLIQAVARETVLLLTLRVRSCYTKRKYVTDDRLFIYTCKCTISRWENWKGLIGNRNVRKSVKSRPSNKICVHVSATAITVFECHFHVYNKHYSLHLYIIFDPITIHHR
jgi:hypothetical protein